MSNTLVSSRKSTPLSIAFSILAKATSQGNVTAVVGKSRPLVTPSAILGSCC